MLFARIEVLYRVVYAIIGILIEAKVNWREPN
jgi:hypothetical protein